MPTCGTRADCPIGCIGSVIVLARVPVLYPQGSQFGPGRVFHNQIRIAGNGTVVEPDVDRAELLRTESMRQP